MRHDWTADGVEPVAEPAAPCDIIDVAVAAGSFTQLADALTMAGLVDALEGEGPFTVFAPTDDAFAALAAVPEGDPLQNVLLYHVNQQPDQQPDPGSACLRRTCGQPATRPGFRVLEKLALAGQRVGPRSS